MHRGLTKRIRVLRTVSLLVLVGASACYALADPLSFTLIPGTLSGGPGQTVIFTGQITNTSGTTLDAASDLFFNFSDYDPGSIADISQLLGNPDFTLPNDTFSPVVDLFSVTLANTAGPGTQTVDVQLEDVNNDLSATLTADIMVTGTPEPSALFLFATGFIAVLLRLHSPTALYPQWRVGKKQES